MSVCLYSCLSQIRNFFLFLASRVAPATSSLFSLSASTYALPIPSLAFSLPVSPQFLLPILVGSYPAWKSHSSASYYIVIIGLSDYHIFSTLSHKRHDFRDGVLWGGLLNMKCVFWLPLQLSLKTFLILRRIQQVLSFKCALLSDFNHIWFFGTDFEKYSNRISWKFVQWGRIFLCGRTDRQTWRS